MEEWIDDKCSVTGFAQDSVELLRDLPNLGVVQTLSVEDGKEGRYWVVKP